MEPMETLRVAADTRVSSLANAIAHALTNQPVCAIIAIGAAAVSTAVKGIASANGLLSSSGYKISTTPYFRQVTMKNSPDEKRTAMAFQVERTRVAVLGEQQFDSD